MKKGFDFPKGKTLKGSSNIHVVVYVPSTKAGDVPISKREFLARIKDVRGFLRSQFGGSTTVSGVGDWSDSGKVYTERIAKVETFTTSSDYDRADLKIKKWLLNKKRAWQQKSLSFEWEENLIFI